MQNAVHEAIIDLYLQVKIRSNDEVSILALTQRRSTPLSKSNWQKSENVCLNLTASQFWTISELQLRFWCIWKTKRSKRQTARGITVIGMTTLSLTSRVRFSPWISRRKSTRSSCRRLRRKFENTLALNSSLNCTLRFFKRRSTTWKKNPVNSNFDFRRPSSKRRQGSAMNSTKSWSKSRTKLISWRKN